MDPVVTIIIPTHNRRASLQRLLARLEQQDLPKEQMEVIVAADGCTDGTVAWLQSYQPGYPLRWIELPGGSAARARNRGASAARGRILLFIDDDIEPSEGLVSAHLRAHGTPSTVVIGYLPLQQRKGQGFFGMELRAWWEHKFYRMAQTGYRFGFEDLLSGNFSVARQFFIDAGGFDEGFACREDYELGVRLVRHGADLVFSRAAWGWHCDEITGLDRSLRRKRLEGTADALFMERHPGMKATLRQPYFSLPLSRTRKLFIYIIIYFYFVTDQFALLARWLMGVMEKLRARRRWQAVNYKLHMYWYIRGLMDARPQNKALYEMMREDPPSDLPAFTLDLKNGMAQAMRQLDEQRPDALQLVYGSEPVALVAAKPGLERLRGRHLWPLVEEELRTGLAGAVSMDSALNNVENKIYSNT